jgi:dipeptidase E
MKKILLTSTGLQYKAIADTFLAVTPVKPEDLKVLFIPTASRTEEEMFFVRKSLNELLSVGVKNENVKWFDPDVRSTHLTNPQFDCLYVCGGNTFFLLHKLKESGFFLKISKWVNEGLFYVGASAGSVIASPDINYILWMDGNDIGLKDTSGFSFIISSIIPHYTDDFATAASDLRLTGKEVVTISDSEALLIQGNQIYKVG